MITKLTMVTSALALSAGAAFADDTIPIATIGPITGSNAAFGVQLQKGAEQAVADINAKGGVLGKKLVLTVEDDACDPKLAVQAANSVAAKKVVFVGGHFCSSSAIPASEVYAENGILLISPAATNPKLTEDAFAKHWTNVFRTCGRDDQQGHVAGTYLASTFKGKAVAILDDKTTYGKGLADETRKAANAAGLKEVIDESINDGDVDFSALISKLKQANVAAIYCGCYQKEAGLIVRQAHEQGLNAVLMAGDALPTQEFWAITGDAGNGTLFTFAADPEKKPSAKAIVDEFKKNGYEPEGYTLYTYATVQIFAQAAEKAKSTKLADVVKAMHSTTFDTVIGPIKYDEKGDITVSDFVVWKWKDGKYAEL